MLNANCKSFIADSSIYNLHFAICILQYVPRVLCVLCGYLAYATTIGSTAELVRLEGEPVDAKLQAVNRKVITFVGKAPNRLPIHQLVRWGHPREPRPQILAVLTDGGRLVTSAAWSGGSPVRRENDTIVVLTDLWGEVPLARSLVRGLVFAQRSHPKEREELEQTVRDEPSPSPSLRGSGNMNSDLVLLTNKDRVTGKLAAITGGSLTLETGGGAVKLPLSRVEAIVFGSEEPGGSPAARPQPARYVVGTRDGSVVYASAISSNEDRLRIEAANGLALAGGSVNDVALLQSLGGRFTYLSDLEPQGYRHVPYLSIEWPYTRDRNVVGEPLSAGGKRYLKGIGMHAAARLTYRLDGNYRRFDAAVAIDDSARNRGSVTFGVYVLRESAWIEAFTSGIVRGGEVPRLVSVDLAGAQGLTLTVDYADRGDELDRANWLDARLVKAEM